MPGGEEEEKGRGERRGRGRGEGEEREGEGNRMQEDGRSESCTDVVDVTDNRDHEED